MVPITAHPTSIPATYKDQYTAYTENAEGFPVIGADSMRIFFDKGDGDFQDEGGFVALSNNLR